MAHVLRLVLAAFLLRSVGGLGSSRTGSDGSVSKVGLIGVDGGGRGQKVIVEVPSGLLRVLPGRTTLQVLLGKDPVCLRLADVAADIFLNLQVRVKNVTAQLRSLNSHGEGVPPPLQGRCRHMKSNLTSAYTKLGFG